MSKSFKSSIKMEITGDLDNITRRCQEITTTDTSKLVEKMGSLLENQVRENFANTYVEDTLLFGTAVPEVTVTSSKVGNDMVVNATGKDAVFVEFGAGVYHNGPSSANPYASTLGLEIGTYGKGYGNRNVWGYYEGDTLILTHGTQAQMPMANAISTVKQQYPKLAKEVFKK